MASNALTNAAHAQDHHHDGHHHDGHHDDHHGHHDGKKHVRKGAWRYDPSNYDVARDFQEMQAQRNMGPMTWSPMQVRDIGMGSNTHTDVLPGAALALTDAAMPYSNVR